jgi:ketosteroid isomerase-like protein
MRKDLATLNRQLIQRFWQAIGSNNFEEAGACLHDDYVLDWPQSGERIRGRENFIAVNANYPAAGPWRVTVHRIIADDSGAASDVTVTDGAVRARAITFSEVRDGRIAHQTEYWPDPMEAPAWRAQWVERMD